MGRVPVDCVLRLVLLASALVQPLGCGDSSTSGNRCTAVGSDCSLRQAAQVSGVRIGAAVRSGFEGDAYTRVLVREFDSVTAESAMKWNQTQPRRGVFDFDEADRLVALAEANDMAVRGHTLVWDQATIGATPPYVEEIRDPEEMRAVLSEHITTVVGHFRGRVDAWDVVNEPLETVGSTLYENAFHRALGPSYIAEALRLAHDVDPHATLFVNEVLADAAGPKIEALIQLARDLLADGAPLHGVGLQGHFFGPPRPQELRRNLQELADLGLIVELTEIDIVLRPAGSREAQLEQQRQDYFDVACACLAVASCRRMTLWGFTDRFTWLDGFVGPGSAPLIFNGAYGPKPAYFGLREALAKPASCGEWSYPGSVEG